MRKNILIIKLGALGDVVMATGLVERILQHHAPRRVTLLTSPAYGGLFSARPDLELKTFDRNSLRATLATVLWMRNRRFLRVYDLQSNDRHRRDVQPVGHSAKSRKPPALSLQHTPAKPLRGPMPHPHQDAGNTRRRGHCFRRCRAAPLSLRGGPGNGVRMVAATGFIGPEIRYYTPGRQRPAPGKALALLRRTGPVTGAPRAPDTLGRRRRRPADKR